MPRKNEQFLMNLIEDDYCVIKSDLYPNRFEYSPLSFFIKKNNPKLLKFAIETGKYDNYLDKALIEAINGDQWCSPSVVKILKHLLMYPMTNPNVVDITQDKTVLDNMNLI